MRTYTDHKFVKKVIEDMAWYYKNPNDKVKADYSSKVNSNLNLIKSNLEMLMTVRLLLAETINIPETKYNSAVPKPKALRYHIENFFLRVTTYKDLIKQLVAAIYEWSLPAKGFRYKEFEKNGAAWKIADIKLVLETTEKLFANTRNSRNKIAHEGAIGAIDVLLPEILNDFQLFIDSLPQPLKEKVPFDINEKEFEQYKLAMNIKSITEMMQIEEDLATHLFSVLDLLYDKYLGMIPDIHPLQ